MLESAFGSTYDAPCGMSRVRTLELICTAVVAAFALLAFAHAWSFGLTYLDDNDIVLTKAGMLAQWASVRAAFTQRYFLNDTNLYYRPLVNLSFVWDAHLAGAQPWIYHVTNGALHACASGLFYLWLRQLAVGRVSALISACLFAVHPMHVASVVWVPGRNDLLLGVFALGALVLLEKESRGFVAGMGHWLCFVGALLCKETAVCLPVIFATILTRTRPKLENEQRAALGIVWGATLVGYLWVHRQVVPGSPANAAKALSALLAHPAAIVSELGKVFLPIRLQVVATIKDVDFRPGLIALAGIVALVIGLRRELSGRVMLTAGGLILLPLVMALCASDFIMLENRLYLTVAGACLFIAVCLQALERRSLRYWKLGLALIGSVVLVFSATSFRYSANFRDRYAFSDAAIKAAPSSYLAMWLQAQRSFHGGQGAPKANNGH